MESVMLVLGSWFQFLCAWLETLQVTFHPHPLRSACSGFGRIGHEGQQLSGREEGPDAVTLVAAVDARIQESADSKGRQRKCASQVAQVRFSHQYNIPIHSTYAQNPVRAC